MESVKTISNSKNGKSQSTRLRFQSSRKRSQNASADIYRHYKRRYGVTSAAAREERVHHHQSKTSDKDKADDVHVTTFCEELDIAMDRNASQLFAEFYRKAWPLVRSLPEVLHHAESIVKLLNEYLLTCNNDEDDKNENEDGEEGMNDGETTKGNKVWSVNPATTDLLHLYAVLARDLRHEIHPYLHTLILPRFWNDLLAPPPSQKHQEPTPVTIVEAAFRSLSYLFRYDSSIITDDSLEPMRAYYGATLAHRRELVRRLSAETFAPLIRKLPSEANRKRHVKRVLKALAKTPLAPQQQRLQADAVDGIAQLLFQVCRGSSGQLHSKGKALLDLVLDNCAAGAPNVDLVHQVARAFFQQLGQSLNAPAMMDILSMTTALIGKKCNDKGALDDALFLIQLLTSTLEAYPNVQSVLQDEAESLPVVQMMGQLLSREFFACLSTDKQQGQVFQLLNVVASTVPEVLLDTAVMEGVTHALVDASLKLEEGEPTALLDILVGDLLPSIEGAMEGLGSAIVSAAAALSSSHPTRAQQMIHAVASTRIRISSTDCNNDSENDDDDRTLFVEQAKKCHPTAADREALLALCSKSNGEGKKSGKTQRGDREQQDAVLSRALCFVALLPCEKHGKKALAKATKAVVDWHKGYLKRCKRQQNPSKTSAHLITAALGDFARYAGPHIDDTSTLSSVVESFFQSSLQCLQGNPTSPLALQATRSLLDASQLCDSFALDRMLKSELFERLSPNLQHQNHFVRRHTLGILVHFPKLCFVVDHADLDLTGSLEEETMEGGLTPTGGSSGGGASSKGECNLMEMLEQIETTPLTLSSERHICSMVAQIEVLGRNAKLPVVYAEAAAHHMIGLVRAKFAPLWPACTRAVATLSRSHTAVVWPVIWDAVSRLTLQVPRRSSQDAGTGTSNASWWAQCESWDTSLDKALFASSIAASEQKGRVSRHFHTDDATVFQHYWEILASNSTLLAQNSKDVVPLFFKFLHTQLFAMSFGDPDAKELDIKQYISDDCEQSVTADIVRYEVQQRLRNILKGFASVKGPEQLFRHQVLRKIYTCLLGHSDHKIAESALTCLLRYKGSPLSPLKEQLQKLLSRNKLREGLLDLKTMDEEGKLPNDDRRTDFLVAICRLLFGRLSAKAGRSSSKDTPASRRNAILAFVASVCKTESEFGLFIHLMTRAYLPAADANVAEQVSVSSMQLHLKSTNDDEFGRLPQQVHMGYLNTLDAVIRQFGQNVQNYAPIFFSIVFKIYKSFDVGDCGQIVAYDDDHNEPVEEDEPEVEVPVDGAPSERAGKIRGLCYRRLSELFCVYARSLSDVSAYADELWDSLRKSLAILPQTVMSASKSPALLGLLKTLSEEASLIALFRQNQDAVASLIRCFDAETNPSSTDLCLTIFSNFLADESNGKALMRENTLLLLGQFQKRLDACSAEARKSVWHRELDILCKLCEVVDSNLDPGELSSIGQGLVSNLLPFLDNKSRVSEYSKRNIVSVLTKFICFVPEETAAVTYKDISRLFGPSKGCRGIDSIGLRHDMAQFVHKLTESSLKSATAASQMLVKLCAMSVKRVEEIDAETIINALSALSAPADDEYWSKLCSASDPSMLSPVLNICFSHLYSEDGVVSRGSLRALKDLGRLSFRMMEEHPEEQRAWQRLLEGAIVSHCRVGIASHNQAVRKHYVLLLRELLISNNGNKAPNLHHDLKHLVREDTPDLDFFLSYTHVQVHRRARALQRLRKEMTLEDGSSRFVPQSLTYVLLPLAVHTVYESVTKEETSVALEGIATTRALAKHLSWTKYYEILWTTLTQFHRHEKQEHYLVGLICSLMDAFHYSTPSEGSPIEAGSSVSKALKRRILPKLEELLIKKGTDRHGNESKALRPSMILAMVKLFKKLPHEDLIQRLPRLLSVVCNTLRSRDLNVRATGRETISKVTEEIGIDYLPDVMRELALTLKEGYQLHVRSAAVHSILLKLSEGYSPMAGSEGVVDPAVPGIMDLIQQDLFGKAQERKDAVNSAVSYVKEAGGEKSSHSLEVLGSMIFFDPSASGNSAGVSSVVALVTPFLERLRDPDVSVAIVKRSKECLSRIAIGITKNSSAEPSKLLPFVYSTLKPFLDEMAGHTDLSVSLDEKMSDERKGVVVAWHPRLAGSAKSSAEAKALNKMQSVVQRSALDGASAPKLTGSNRHQTQRQKTNAQAGSCAVQFGLQLLHSTLRKQKHNSITDEMLDPFVTQLSICFCECGDSDIVLLSLKCLGLLLRSKLPSVAKCLRALASKTLDLLTAAGSSTNVNPDLLQSSFKMLTFLFGYGGVDSDQPLDDSQMEILLSFLRVSLTDSEQHNAAMGLVKAIISRKYLSPEVYDLADTLLELTVRSSKSSQKEQSASALVSFLVNYPLSEGRLADYIHRIMLNLQYEHADGRISAVRVVTFALRAFPTPVVEKYAKTIFLPLALQLANEDDKGCRHSLTQCVAKLLDNLPPASIQSLFDFTLKWSQGSTELRILAMKLVVVFVDGKGKELVRQKVVFDQVLDSINAQLGHQSSWEVRYFAVLALEKLHTLSTHMVNSATHIWERILAGMADEKHAWIRVASTRLLSVHLTSLDAETFAKTRPATFLLELQGSLFQLLRNLCFQLGVPEKDQLEDYVPLCVKCLTWCLRAAMKFPNLCEGDGPTKDDATTKNNRSKDPVNWLFTRLSNIAKVPAPRRRQAIYKCFASFVTSAPIVTEQQHLLELMLTPLNRSLKEARSVEVSTMLTVAQNAEPVKSPEEDLAQEVWNLIEEAAPSETFLSAMRKVQNKAQEKSERRKEERKAEYVLDPEKAAERRIRSKERDRKRKKRKVDIFRKSEGRSAKRRSGIGSN